MACKSTCCGQKFNHKCLPFAVLPQYTSTYIVRDKNVLAYELTTYQADVKIATDWHCLARILSKVKAKYRIISSVSSVSYFLCASNSRRLSAIVIFMHIYLRKKLDQSGQTYRCTDRTAIRGGSRGAKGPCPPPILMNV